MIGIMVVAGGLALLWAMLAAPGDGFALATGAAGVGATMLMMHWLGLAAGGEPATLARLQLWLAGTTDRAASAVRVLGATLSARPAAKAGLVRVRMRATAPATHAAFALAASAAPGCVAVDIDDEALLLHALDEEGVDVAALVALEKRAGTGAGEGRA